MIRYSLHCPENHRFDSWFQSAGAFEALASGGHLSCPVCGSVRVEKALMAPAVLPSRGAGEVAKPSQDLPPTDLQHPVDDREAALAALRRAVEENSDYVGENFVAEVRAIQDGLAPERSIYGEARLDEARKLLDEGIPVAPLPFLPMRKVN